MRETPLARWPNRLGGLFATASDAYWVWHGAGVEYIMLSAAVHPCPPELEHMGYVPLFDHLTTGSLCGKWPDIGLWPVILSMADRFGRIDVHPGYISNITGLDEKEVVACMERFCEPDPMSRTTDYEGRRLERLDAHRTWGWQVLNHGAYRERARLLAKNNAAVASGQEAERKRRSRNSPPLSAEVRPSDSYSDTDVRALRSSSSSFVKASSSDRANGQDVLQKRETKRRSVVDAVQSVADTKRFP